MPRPKWLLDENISPAVAAALRRAGGDARAVSGSPDAGANDADILRRATSEGRFVVTVDVRFTAAYSLVVREGLDPPGVMLVSRATISSADVGALARAIAALGRRIEAGLVDAGGVLFLAR